MTETRTNGKNDYYRTIMTGAWAGTIIIEP